MTKFFRKYGKQLLAVASAGLMIAFFLPNGQSRSRGEGRVVAHFGKTPVSLLERQSALDEWRLLTQMGAQLRPADLMEEMKQHPDLYLLLQREARAAGVQVPIDQVGRTLRGINNLGHASSDVVERYRRAVTNFLLVQMFLDQFASEVKVSQPEVEHELAMVGQQIKLNLVEFPIDEYKNAVPPPSPQQVQDQFSKFANEPAGGALGPTTNPFGFGYRYPNRVKVQYIEVPYEKVAEALRPTKPQIDWLSLAWQYYFDNQANYTTRPSKQASSQPTTASSQPAQASATAPSTGAALAAAPSAAAAATQPPSTRASDDERPMSEEEPSTTPSATQAGTRPAGPTTLPFEAVKDRVMRDMMRPMVEAQAAEIVARLNERLAADWQSYAAGANAAGTQPTSGPASAPTGGFGSVEYLNALAADIEKEFKVRPKVVALFKEWRGAKELSELPGIGKAFADKGTFAELATQGLEPFVAAGAQSDPGVMKLLQPFEPLRDAHGNVYIFQVTAAAPAGAPASLDEVAEKVREDARTAAAYEAAREDARKLFDAAVNQGLVVAAESAHKPVITTGPFTPQFPQAGLPIPNYPLDPAAEAKLVEEAFKLLTVASLQNPHPVKLIEMPEAGHAVVAELASVEPMWKTNSFMYQATVARELEAVKARRLQYGRFNYNAIASRLDYRPEASASGS